MSETDLPRTMNDRLRPASCALIVIDMQNDFCARGGYIDSIMKKDVGAAAGVVPAIRQLIEAARAAAVPVFWVGADYSRERIPASMRVKLDAQGITAECCKPGSWGAEWFGLVPYGEESIVYKHTYSGFHSTGLHERLQAAGVRTAVFAGVQTQICVESTVREAHSLGYFCVVPEDAVASHTPTLHHAALTNIRFLFGDVSAVPVILDAWSALAVRDRP
jgi:ureidoacrylate peracid hydrolase